MSNKPLFDLRETNSLSPYKAWERKNRIKTHFAPHMEEDKWCASRTIQTCGHSMAKNGDQYSAFGETRDEAIATLCRKLSIPVYGTNQTKR